MHAHALACTCTCMHMHSHAHAHTRCMCGVCICGVHMHAWASASTHVESERLVQLHMREGFVDEASEDGSGGWVGVQREGFVHRGVAGGDGALHLDPMGWGGVG